ncbi:MAG: prepilin-type N-terminal cleavage/methylation domain-containing protein [Bdellovibrionales bacterium]|nr:prepilin-type N-terminal cleavage/methylation domain-containing protein [Bdellovibrionales bacterium]
MINKKGFSLFEVLIAMVIMASAAALLSTAWGGNQMRVQKIAINNKAAFLLDQIVSELEIKYANKFTQIPDNEEGTFDGNPDFTWSMRTQDFEMPDLSSLLIQGDDGNQMLLMIVDKLTEYMNESVKEMKVTITYAKGKKKVKYSATTFLVDFNKPIPMGGLPGGLGQ